MPLKLTEIKPGIIFEADDFTVTAFPVTHKGPDCLGYIFEEKARRPFLASKADELGVPFGPERRDLVAGKEITLPDGKRILASFKHLLNLREVYSDPRSEWKIARRFVRPFRLAILIASQISSVR